MGRELRRVPANWNHPKNAKGNYIPLSQNFAESVKNWDERNAKWQAGMRSDYNGGWQPKGKECGSMTFEQWEGERPVASDYMPDWSEEEKTHMQMYEDTSEGTPISPVMKSPEELAHWLADNNASAFGSATATYEQWLNTIHRGSAVGCAIIHGKIISGVAL